MGLSDHHAKKIWKAIKSQLEDRSVLQLGSVDSKTLDELEAEQLATIKDGLVNFGQQIAGYRYRPD